MSKARQLADLLDSNGDVVVGALDNAPDPDLTPYATNTSVASNLVNVKQDLGILAFESARADNRVAYNLPNAFIDQFEDDSGIDTQSNSGLHNESLFTIGTAYTPVATTTGMNGGNASAYNGGTPAPNAISYTGYDGVTRPQGAINGTWGSRDGSYASYILDHVFEPTDDFEVVVRAYGNFQGVGQVFQTSLFNLSSIDFGNSYWDSSASAMQIPSGLGYAGQYHAPVGGDGGNAYWNLYRWSRINGTFKLQYTGRSGTAIGALDASSLSTLEASTNYVQSVGSPTSLANNYVGVGWGEASGSQNIFYIELARTIDSFDSASGNFTGVTQTASASVSKMSIVVMYEDNAGTATLNTDLVAQVSANNGTDWTTVNLASAPNLSGSIKVAKSNEVAVTAGTQPKYRINFANQAAGSKVTRVLGVSLLY